MDIHWSTTHPVNSIDDTEHITKYEFGIPNQNRRQSDLRQFSVYDEVYIGLGHFRKMMRWTGLLPIIEVFTEATTNSVVAGLDYSICSPWALYSFIPGITVSLLFYLGLWHYTFQLADATEIVVVGCFLVFFCVTAWVNWFTCIVIAPYWQMFFRRFQVIDCLLDIEWDGELRSIGKRLVILFATIGSIFGTVLAFVTMKQILFESYDNTRFIAIVSFFTYSIGCHFFPEALFVYLCQAINIRIRRCAHLLIRNFYENDNDIVVSIENVRIAHQLILDSIQNLNHMMGPVLVFFCIFNTYTLCLCVYFFLLQSISILGMTPCKETLLIISFVRIVPLCLLANKVQEKITSKSVYQLETSRYNKKCKDEVLFLLTNLETTIPPSFTAWEFWDVDQGFLTTVSGILLTYAITALQFAKINKQDKGKSFLDEFSIYNNSNWTAVQNLTLLVNEIFNLTLK